MVAFRNAAFLCLAASAVLSACQPEGTPRPTMSLAEARQVATGIQAQAFTPPPRSVVDIDRLLAAHAETGAAERAAFASRAGAAPPANASDGDLVRFHFERAHAASFIERPLQMLADLQAARAILERTGAQELGGIALRDVDGALAVSHRVVGDTVSAQRHATAAYRAASIPGHRMASAALAAAETVFNGDLAGARSLQATALSLEPVLNSPQFVQVNVPLVRARLRLTDGILAAAAGDAEAAERHLRDAIGNTAIARQYSGTTLVFDQRTSASLLGGTAWIQLSEVYAQGGRHVEAEQEARAALSEIIQRFGRGSTFTLAHLGNLGRIVLQQDRAADAVLLASRTIAAGGDIGIPPQVAWLNRARATLGTALLMQGQPAEAARSFDVIETALASSGGLFEAVFQSDVTWAIALVQAGDARRAARNLEAALGRREGVLGTDGPGLSLMRGALAMARRATGDGEGALRLCRVGNTLGALMESVPKGAIEAMQRKAVLEDYLGLMADAARLGRAGDPATEAFRVAEVLRGGASQRALAQASLRHVLGAGDPELATLARQEQEVDRQAQAAGERLGAILASGASDQTAVQALRVQVQALESAGRILKAELTRRYPAYARLIEPQPVTPEEIQAALQPQEAMVATYVLPDRLLIWGIPKVGRVAFAVTSLGAASLQQEVASLRAAVDSSPLSFGEIPAFDVAAAHRLFAAVLQPVAAAWQPASHLLTVPHGALSELPWQLLPTAPARPAADTILFSGYRSVPWLARSHAVSALPSAASLISLRTAGAGKPDRRPFLGFGDPVFGAETSTAGQTRGRPPAALRASPGTRGLGSAGIGDLTPLPETADEILSVASAVGADKATDVFLDPAASERTVKAMSSNGRMAGYRVISFATHGLVPGDLDGLAQPALALSNPAVAGGGGDGLLTLEEVLALNLDADWAVLSACNTAAASNGGETFSGLGRAFFHAGARALLLSAWPVHSRATRDLMVDLFARQAGEVRGGRAESLRQAMLTMIDRDEYREDNGQVVSSYAHPVFWAPFTLLGDGAGGS